MRDPATPGACTARLVITGSVGVEAKFLLLSKEVRATVYQKQIERVTPDIKACRG